MNKHVKKALVIFLAITTLCSSAGCSQTQSNNSAKLLPWIEYNGAFMTTNFTRAQDEIPFRIILPTYIAEDYQEIPLPGIKGPLKRFQKKGEVEIEIDYIITYSSDNYGFVTITESERAIIPGNSENATEINGKRVVLWSGNYSLGPGYFFFFEGSDIYFIVETNRISYEESIKIVESMIKQL